jgi:retron-type reverse transcriptase
MLPPLRIAPSWWKRMSSGSYFPPPVKAVPIPKKSGGVRICATRRRSVQRVASAILLSHRPLAPLRPLQAGIA